MKKILVVTMNGGAYKRNQWSGITRSMYDELKKYYQIDNYVAKKHTSVISLIRLFYIRFIKRKFASLYMFDSYAKRESKKIMKLIKRKKYDLVLAMHISSAGILAYLSSNVPTIYYTDSTFSSWFDYYMIHVDKKIRSEICRTEQMALNNATKIVVSTQWAKNGVMNDYKIDDEKIDIAPFGANVIQNGFQPKEHKGIHILFVGVDWKRKGADVALECIRELRKISDKQYVLHIVGCEAPYRIKDDNVKLYGFLNRDKEDDAKIINSLYEIADIFLLPTRAEAAGIVFSEACSYYLPSITYATGGTGEHVINDYNGYRLPPGSDGKEFAKVINDLVEDPNKLNLFKNNARRLYEEKLNWQVSGKKMRQIIDHTILEYKK